MKERIQQGGEEITLACILRILIEEECDRSLKGINSDIDVAFNRIIELEKNVKFLKRKNERS